MKLKAAVETAKKYNLNAPDEFWNLSLEELRSIVNRGGCGPGDSGDRLVPDTVWGLNIKPA